MATIRQTEHEIEYKIFVKCDKMNLRPDLQTDCAQPKVHLPTRGVKFMTKDRSYYAKVLANLNAKQL